MRTLLYYYCSERYGIRLKDEGIRLAGDEIPVEECFARGLSEEELIREIDAEVGKMIL